MEMTNIFTKLKMLQDILVEKYAIELRIEEAPKVLYAQDELLARLKKEYIEKSGDKYVVINIVTGEYKILSAE